MTEYYLREQGIIQMKWKQNNVRYVKMIWKQNRIR